MADDATFTSGDIARAEKQAVAEASPAPHSETTEAPAPAATAPAAVTETPIDRIPLEDHKRIVDGFHDRLDRLGWASRYNPDEVEEAMRLRAQARQQATRGEPKQAPQPDVQDPQTGEWFYSAAQGARLAKFEMDTLAAQLREEFAERLTPIETSHQQAQLLDGLSTQIQAATSWPGFAEHVDAITAAIGQNTSQRQRDPSVPKLTLHEAYIQVAVPHLESSRQALEVEIRKSIAAEMQSTSARSKDDIHPGRGPAASHKADKDKSMKEVLAEEFARRASA